MARRRKRPAPEQHDRWLISYADFITLLFAFFVVMFASSETNKAKAKQVSESVEKAFRGDTSASQTPHPAERAAPPSHFADLTPSLHLLEQQLSSEIKSGKMRISLQSRGLVITLGEAAFFRAGDDRIQPAAYSSLEKVASALTKIPNPVRLEGHTDSVPIHSARFSSNWELSTARALIVLKALEDNYSINRFRLSAAGYADTAAVESNETEAGRAHNRRVDLVVLSRSGGATEP